MAPTIVEMINEAVTALGEDMSRDDIAKYVRSHHGNVNRGSIDAEISNCTVNNPGRIHKSINQKEREYHPQYDLLYSYGSRVQKYRPEVHGNYGIVRKNNKYEISRGFQLTERDFESLTGEKKGSKYIAGRFEELKEVVRDGLSGYFDGCDAHSNRANKQRSKKGESVWRDHAWFGITTASDASKPQEAIKFQTKINSKSVVECHIWISHIGQVEKAAVKKILLENSGEFIKLLRKLPKAYRVGIHRRSNDSDLGLPVLEITGGQLEEMMDSLDAPSAEFYVGATWNKKHVISRRDIAGDIIDTFQRLAPIHKFLSSGKDAPPHYDLGTTPCLEPAGSNEAKGCQNILRTSLGNVGEVREDIKIGWKSQQKDELIHRIKKHGIWWKYEEGEEKYWHMFGIADTEGELRNGMKHLVCQFSIPVDSAEAGSGTAQFLKDGNGRHYIGHTGVINKGRREVTGPSDFAGWQKISVCNMNRQMIVISALDDDKIAERISRFVRTAQTHKTKQTTTASAETFPWIRFYSEFADSLIAHRRDRGPLVKKIHDVYKTMDLEISDKFSDGTTGPLEDICPFTTMSLFNRGLTDKNREKIAEALAEFLRVREQAPNSFDGIPILFNLRVLGQVLLTHKMNL